MTSASSGAYVAIAFLELGQLGLGLGAMARHQCDALTHDVTPRRLRCIRQQAPTLARIIHEIHTRSLVP